MLCLAVADLGVLERVCEQHTPQHLDALGVPVHGVRRKRAAQVNVDGTVPGDRYRGVAWR